MVETQNDAVGRAFWNFAITASERNISILYSIVIDTANEYLSLILTGKAQFFNKNIKAIEAK